MITKEDRNAILKYAKKYNVSEVYLFGSSIERENADDIDIGIRGILPGLFFDFYGELLLELSKSLDIVDLSKDSSFNRLVIKEGVKLYG